MLLYELTYIMLYSRLLQKSRQNLVRQSKSLITNYNIVLRLIIVKQP
jgi:hypothetical protein